MDANKTNQTAPKSDDSFERRSSRQEQDDPSGHGMQVRPGQQREIAQSTDRPGQTRAATEFDEKTLDDLKNEPQR